MAAPEESRVCRQSVTDMETKVSEDGNAERPSGEFSFRQAADDVDGLLRHLGLDTVKAVGLSGAGITLLHMATALPTRIESMVIVSAPPYFPAQARALQPETSELMFPFGLFAPRDDMDLPPSLLLDDPERIGLPHVHCGSVVRTTSICEIVD